MPTRRPSVAELWTTETVFALRTIVVCDFCALCGYPTLKFSLVPLRDASQIIL